MTAKEKGINLKTFNKSSIFKIFKNENIKKITFPTLYYTGRENFKPIGLM